MKKSYFFNFLSCLAILFFAQLVFATTALADDVAVTGITLDKTAASVALGSTTKLTATIAPTTATTKTITWTSSDESIATVSGGTVTAVKCGTCTITATSASNTSISATCEITVTAAVSIAGFWSNQSHVGLSEGGTYQLVANVQGIDDHSVTWTSANDNVVSVDQDGNVVAKTFTGISPQNVHVTATAKDGAAVYVTVCVYKTNLSRDEYGYLKLTGNDDWTTYCNMSPNGAWNYDTYNVEKVRMYGDISTTTDMVSGFAGIFDGNGHTLNVTYNDGGNLATVAPFKNTTSSSAEIKNLHITGSITATGYKNYVYSTESSLVGSVGSNELNISNCWSSVSLNGGDYTSAFVCHVNGKSVNINNCLFDGVLGANTKDIIVAGFAGNACTISNSLVTASLGYEFTRGYNFTYGKPTLTNCYYVNNVASSNQGTQVSSADLIDGVTLASLLTGNAGAWIQGASSPVPAVFATADAITITDSHYATYYNSKKYTLPAGVTAYIVTGVTDGKIDKTEVTGVIPAGTGLLLYSATPGVYAITDLGSASGTEATVTGNLLKGSDDAATTTGAGNFYKLSYDSNSANLGFYYGAASGVAFTNGAHKAYLAYNGSISAKDCFGVIDNSEITGINSILNGNIKANTVYTISGMRMKNAENLKSGLYIINGKKVAIK